MTSKFTKLFRQLHNDEEGLESLQVVMIIAIAAMILIAAATVGKQGVDWMTGQTDNIVGKDLTAFGVDEAIEMEE
jgi:hypothetical protein